MPNPLMLAAATFTIVGATAVVALRPDTTATAPPRAPVGQVCGSRGHPCTWAEVSEGVYNETHALSRAAAYLIGARGRSTDTVATLLALRDGVAEISHDATAIRFRLDGGRPAWVLGDIPGEGITKGGGTMVGTPTLAPRTTAPGGAGSYAQPIATPIGVLSAPQQQTNTKGLAVGREGQAKHAIVAAAYEWEFDAGVGRDIVAPLRQGKQEARGYSPTMGGTVVFLTNPDTMITYGNAGVAVSPQVGETEAQGTVDLSAFEGWADKDFIYISTHGRALCSGTDEDNPGECRTTLSVGKFRDPFGELLERFGEEPGITVHYSSTRQLETPECELEDDEAVFEGSLNPACFVAIEPSINASLGVTTEFFAAHYGTGLPNSIVFLDACQSLLHGDIGRILVGNSTKTFVFGFNRMIMSGFAHQIAEEVLKLMLDGTPTSEWRKKLSWEMSEGLVVMGGSAKSDGPGAASAIGASAAATVAEVGGRVRGRDVVELHDPMTGEELEDGGALRLVGVPGDGVPDSVHVKSLGVGMPDLDEANSMELTITLDSSQVLPDPLRFASRPGVDTSAVQRTVALGFDATPGQVVDIVIRGETPSGEFTEWPYDDVRLESCGWWARIVEPDGAVSTVSGSAGRVNYTGPESWQLILQRGRTPTDSPYESTASLRINRTSLGNPRGLGVPFHMDLGYPGTRGGVTNETILKVQNGVAIGYEWVGEVEVAPAANGGLSGTFSATMVDSGHRQRGADLSSGDVRFPAFEYEVSGAFSMTDPRCVR